MTLMGNPNGTMRSEWNFDETIRGTVKGVPVELDLDEMSDEEWDLQDQEVVIDPAEGTTRVRTSVMAGNLNVSCLPLELQS